MSKSIGILFGLFLFCGSAILAITLYRGIVFWMSPASLSLPLQYSFYEVYPGENPHLIAQDLEKLGVVSNARFFYWYGRLTRKNAKFKAGDYRFSNKMRPDGVMAIIMSGISYAFPIIIPEGSTFEQISEVIEAIRPGSGLIFRQLCSNPIFIKRLAKEFQLPSIKTLEGYLFPNTYLINLKTPVQEIIRQMVKKYRDVMTPDRIALAQAMGLNEYKVLILASMIEKETGSPNERPLIASVFYNRLHRHMKLQSDPTVIYGAKENYDGKITWALLQHRTPYNTYVIKGLPPAPISNPGKEAILAALFPEQTNYFYFVSHNDGTHEFNETYEGHSRAVTKYQLDPKARMGKSWRDLKKRQKEGMDKSTQ